MRASIILLLIAFANVQASDLSTKITAVTVYSQGAQIIRKGSALLAEGQQEWVVRNLPLLADQNAYSLKATGGFTLVSSEYRVNYFSNYTVSDSVEKLQVRLKVLARQIEDENTTIKVLNERMEFLRANRAPSNHSVSLKPLEFSQLADFYAKQTEEVLFKILERTRSVEKINDELKKVKEILNQLNARANEPTGEIVLVTRAEKATQAKFELSYFTPYASWQPMYDIRATDLDKPLDLTFKASVQQNTREDWKQIKLTLSSAQPTAGMIAPTLNPYWLRFYEPMMVVGYGSQKKSYDRASVNVRSESASSKVMMEEEVVMDAAAPTVQLDAQPTSLEFEIDEPYTIANGSSNVSVEITKLQIPAIFQYFAVPKLDKDAFLLARIANWQQYNLLPGEALVFFEDSYAGKTYINPYQSKDTLEMSLGRDKSIVIQRTKINDQRAAKYIGQNKSDFRKWEIKVKNNRNNRINLVLLDQIPLSTDALLTVEVNETSGAKYNAVSGELYWNIDLEKTSAKSVIVEYLIKYHKSKTVILE